MKPIAWIVAGLALTGLAAALESQGNLGTNPVAALPISLPAMLILMGGQYCLWRGFRSGVVAMWSGAFNRSRKTPASAKTPSTYDAADIEPVGGFDADAVFARYMEQRKPDQASPAEQPNEPLVTKPTRPTFGRRNI